MTYSLMGSGASRVAPQVLTQAQVAEAYGTDYVEDEAQQRVLVLEDSGNQVAYVIEGTAVELLDLLDQARDVVIQNIGSGA